MMRSPLLTVIAALALVLAAGALVVHFVIPPNAGGGSRADVEALRAQLSALKTSGSGLRVGYVNVESAGKVFLNAVSTVSQSSTAKAQEIVDLQNSYNAGTVKQDQYDKRLNELNAELADVNISVYVAILDRMIASSSFSDLRSDLRQLRQQAQPLVDTAKNLVSTVKGGAMSASEFQTRLSKVQSSFAQLKGYVDQACVVKIQQAAQKIAITRGMDLVLLQSNVVLYPRPATVTDLTEFVKTEIAGYL